MATATKPAYEAVVKGPTFAGVDQGIDFTGAGSIFSLGAGVITRLVKTGSGWAGEGALLVYRIISGPFKGRYVYVAEDFKPSAGLHVGSPVSKGQTIGYATGSGKAPGIEMGWATATGKPTAPLYPNPHSPKAAGHSFNAAAMGASPSGAGAAAAGATAGNVGGQQTVTGKQFADAVLREIGAPVTIPNENFLAAWAHQEGTAAQFNPFATTLREPGSTAFNPQGVQNYVTAAEGEQATAQTILGGYPTITSELRGGKNVLQDLYAQKPSLISDLNKWVTGQRSTVPSTYTAGIAANVSGGSAADWLSFDLTDAGKAAAQAAKTVGNLALAPVKYVLSWIEGWAVRGLQIIGGAILVMYALLTLAKQAGAPVPRFA